MRSFSGADSKEVITTYGLAKYQTTNNKRPAMKSNKLTSLRILSPRGVSTELEYVRNVSMPL
jgi:hypothetical protein